MEDFIGRKDELEQLRWFLGKKSASFITIRGRRRIGKSRLIEEFAKPMRCITFSGLPPDGATTKQGQLDTFADQISDRFDVPTFQLDSWSKLFRYLGKLVSEGQIILVFDEISWIGSKDPTFLGQLKEAWDRFFSKNTRLMFIVCGSVSSWITKNILSSTGFVGRVSYDMELHELPIADALGFWGHDRSRFTPFEILKILAVTGGVPRYLEELKPHQSAEENISRLCFTKGGLLVREFDQIFSDLFDKRALLYSEMVRALSNGTCTLDELCSCIDRVKTGIISSYLGDLVHAGFVTEDRPWNFRTSAASRFKKYRLSDNYLRFYLHYIEPNLEEIRKSTYQVPLLNRLRNWDSIIGLQFENLVNNNVDAVLRVLRIDRSQLSMYGPYFQRKTQRLRGCQIDLLIQTRYRVLYLCEVKFRAETVGLSVVNELEEKRKRLLLPRGWATRTVLIHVNGVSQPVLESQELDHIVDFADLLNA